MSDKPLSDYTTPKNMVLRLVAEIRKYKEQIALKDVQINHLEGQKVTLQIVRDELEQRIREREAQIGELSKYKRAVENHLCRYDAADWLVCKGGHTANTEGNLYCYVCDDDEAKGEPHDHGKRVAMEQRISELEQERNRLESEIAAVCPEDYSLQETFAAKEKQLRTLQTLAGKLCDAIHEMGAFAFYSETTKIRDFLAALPKE